MSGFNTSSRSGDMSMKLRAQNMRNARDQTKRLEEDNRKMEERLRELKTVMTREKEERERQGGGFWGRGQAQVGSLTKYADEVLSSKAERPPREGKKKKIKVLQDEPIEVPKRSAQPGTMKYIAQRKLPQGPGPVPRDKTKGPRCGQCEDRAATLSCVQCSEIYCPGCFAAFHVKGALKQHRSVPISASGPRVCMSPHPSVDPQQSPRGSQASGSVVSHSASFNEGSGASSARQPPMAQVGAAPTSGGSLLDGAYDESQSAASFQAALMAWREGPSSSPSNSSNSSSPSKDSDRSTESKQLRKVVASPVKSPVIAVDESTGMPEESRVLEIKFTSTLSYAERLLLKKHRRTELAEVSTPRLGNQSPPRNGAGDQSQQIWNDRSRQPVSASSSSLSRRELQAVSSRRNQEQREGTFVDDGERVDFQSLFEAVTLSESPEQLSARRSQSSTSTVAITEIKSNQITEPPQYKTSATYVVEEARPMEAWKIQQRSGPISSATFVKDASGSNVYSSTSSRHTVTDMFPHQELASSSVSNNNLSAMKPSTQNDAQQQSAQRKSKKQHLEDVDLHGQLSRALDADDDPTPRSTMSSRAKIHQDENLSVGQGASKAKMAEAGERKEVKSSQQRPKSTMSSRPKSSAAGSRPGSRAQSRAASRMRIEGVLTKTPSSALSQVAQMSQSMEHTYTYQSPLEDFFLAGVEGQPPDEVTEDRVLTPSKGRKPTSASRPKSRAASAKEEKFKISYKLYKMAPKSWRPDSSLGEAVPLSEVKIDEPQDEMTMSYSYSGQMSGQATEWRPASSHSRLQDNLDLNSSLVFGDEMFTEDAAAAATSAPSTSVTPTPAALSRGGNKPSSSGRFTPSTPQNLHRSSVKDFARRLDDGNREDNDATPTPSASHRKSANRRSVTSGLTQSGLNTPTMVERSSTDQKSFAKDEVRDSNSENITRRSANLRRGLISSGSASSRTASSPLPPTTMVPTPPPPQGSAEKSSVSESGLAYARSGSGVSVRSAQLSRRGLRTPSEQTSVVPQDPGLPADSQRLTSASRKGEHRSHLSSSVTKSGSFADNSSNQDAGHSRSGFRREPTSASRQGTSSSSGLRRHASDINGSSQPKRSQSQIQSNIAQSNSRPASTSHMAVSGQGHRQQTPGQQWRPNSSTGGGEPAGLVKPDMSLRASVQGQGHHSKDTVIADMLHSRVQADGWMDGEDDYDDDDDDDGNDGQDNSEMTGFSHNYDDGNDLDLMRLQMRHQRKDKGDNPALRSSQHWETEVRPFSGRSSINSSRVGNSSSRLAATATGAAGDSKSYHAQEKTNPKLRPTSARALSSMSQASGRESRAIVMDGEDLSMYDTVGAAPAGEDQDTEDRATLDRLEWELASDTGRLTADGQVSRMSILENEDVAGSGSSSRSSAKSLRTSEKDYDVTSKLLEDEQHARDEVDELEMRRSVTLDEDEVKALR
ncbi:zinc finger B-box domain containing protein 1 [Elysia marginata]|uniref:Zinc finger B-box domain containing protein 1 n=1 Tax=Elysia marginata TaxID=1093978 RepID=A0AAV4HI76_9GAST|nr:zinc finger B-box domain containing protein 1 [Elysia marginata]